MDLYRVVYIEICSLVLVRGFCFREIFFFSAVLGVDGYGFRGSGF